MGRFKTMRNVLYLLGGLTVIALVMAKDKVKEVIQKLSRAQFISKYAPTVKFASVGTGLFPSVFLAQAILESGDGNSTLAAKYNNFFGVKADKSWGGKVVELPTKEYLNGQWVTVKEPFRVYSDPIDSFRDRVNFLKVNKRYTTHGVFNALTPEGQANSLQAAGYATDPNYAKLLINIINQNNLKKYDV